jgi:hypothetical protein
MWIDDLFLEIEAYAESIGIESPEVDIDTHWIRGCGRVHIESLPAKACGWKEYKFQHSTSSESLKPIILDAGKDAANRLARFVAMKH